MINLRKSDVLINEYVSKDGEKVRIAQIRYQLARDPEFIDELLKEGVVDVAKVSKEEDIPL